MDVKRNFGKTCRTCAGNFDDDLQPLFVSKNLNIVKMLEGFKDFNFKISEHDNLPKKLCDNCSKQLTQIYMFLLQCEKSEKVLKEKLKKCSENISLEANYLQIDRKCKIENPDDDVASYVDFKDENETVSSLIEDFHSNEENSQYSVKQEYAEPLIIDNNEVILRINSKLVEETSITHKNKKKFQKKTRHMRKRKTKNSNRDSDEKTEITEESHDEDKNLKTNNLSKRDYQCSPCLLSFDNLSNFKEHNKEKHPIQPITYLCDVCGKEFNKRGRLLQHKNKHMGLKPFKCDICEKNFSIKSSLRAHLQRHKNPEHFTCDICAKTFIIKKSYEMHLRRHETGDKLFKCPYCPRTFKLLSTLTHHCTFHNKTLDKKYHCDECNTTFRRSDHLKEHINGVHLKILPFKCELCPQAFVTGAKRNIHVKRMHSGRRYQCNQCEKDFSLPCSLNRHKKSHSGAKSLICEICNESFVTPIQIEKHMETHQLDEVAKNNLITQTYEKIKHIAINQDEIAECNFF